jgi:hypothetical protein
MTLKRTSILRKRPDADYASVAIRKEKKPAKGPRSKKCRAKDCLHRYIPDPANPKVVWCSEDCSVTYLLALGAARRLKLQKADRAVKRAEKAEHKNKIDAAKSIGTLKAEAQVPFNQWVRLRDELAGDPCICCDRMPSGAEALTGGAWDAAHYRGRGSADHLRFDERNVHRALKHCNTYGHTDYRGGLIRKIGLANTEALDADETLVKWTAEYLIWVKKEYAARVVALRKGINRPHQTYQLKEAV